jgi:hypothetical protein
MTGAEDRANNAFPFLRIRKSEAIGDGMIFRKLLAGTGNEDSRIPHRVIGQDAVRSMVWQILSNAAKTNNFV